MDTKVHLVNNTQLKNRILWFDGDSTIPSNHISNIISNGVPTKKLFVDKLTTDIIQYNNLVPVEQQLKIKTKCDPLNLNWTIPEEYKELNPWEYILETFMIYANDKNMLDESGNLLFVGEQRLSRIIAEIKLFQQLKLDNVLRTIIFIINTLTSQRVVWGVGRGSSVSSYVLYILKVHDIDSFKYNLDIKEFLHL